MRDIEEPVAVVVNVIVHIVAMQHQDGAPFIIQRFFEMHIGFHVAAAFAEKVQVKPRRRRLLRLFEFNIQLTGSRFIAVKTDPVPLVTWIDSIQGPGM
jgi:hypothetical protein